VIKMLRRIAAAVVLVPVAVLIVLFAVANRELVVVSFDPFSPGTPILATPPLPLCFVVLVPLIAGVIVGGFATIIGQGKMRRAIRRQQAELRRLRAAAEAARLQIEPQRG
jgi:uncharacterized integral membrane protein